MGSQDKENRHSRRTHSRRTHSRVLWVACDREVQKDHDRVCFGNTDLTRGLAKSSLGPVHVLGVGFGGGIEI